MCYNNTIFMYLIKIYTTFTIILFFNINLIAKDLDLQTFHKLKKEITNNEISIEHFNEKIDDFNITSDIFEISKDLFLDDALSLEDYLDVIGHYRVWSAYYSHYDILPLAI